MGELMAIAQQHRRIAITTPLGKDVLLLRGFTGSEAISQLFHFDLDLLSENDSIKFQDVVGKNVTLRIYDADGKERHWNGFVSRFSQGAQDRRLTAYRAQMVPWLWFLTRTADCRIFQNQKAPDIIQKIFKDLGFSDFKLRLYGDFVDSRLLRAVPRDGFQLRFPLDGRRRHLLFLRAPGWQAHADSGERPGGARSRARTRRPPVTISAAEASSMRTW